MDKYKIESYLVPQLDTRIRLSDFKAGTFKMISSRKGFKNAIKEGLVTVDGKIGYTSDYVEGGELIELYRTDKQQIKRSIDIDIKVIYEDQFLAIVYKPAGIVVSGNQNWTLENGLKGNLTPSDQEDALDRAEPIHRLDYPTSGALIVGKTVKAVIALNKMFENKEIEKRYYAITIGDIPNRGVMDCDIDGKRSESLYETVDRAESPRFGSLNLTKLTPKTGRKHQLRIHMERLGTPILGDSEHCKEGLILKGKGLYLHASSLKFTHPFSGKEISIEIPLPKKFIKIFPTTQI